MLFHLQHQVNDGYWKEYNKDDKLSKDNAELIGASFLKIPFFLKPFTFGIEYHHIHHIDPSIPGYNIQRCHEDLVKKGLLKNKEEIGYIQAFKSLFHTIYDEKKNKYKSSAFFRNIGLEYL